MMEAKKAVFFDIDGTIWDYTNYIPKSTVEAIRALRSKGNSAFICSGRCRSYIHSPSLFEIGFDGVVSGCGTMIEYGSEVVFYHELDRELVAHALKTVRSFGMKPLLEGRDSLYMDYEEFKDDPYGQKLIEEMGSRIKSIKDSEGKWECSKLSCDAPKGGIDECYESLKDEFDFIVHTSNVVEMVPKGFSKATGMRKVAELLGCGMENTLAFGDGENDIEMLQTAGVGIAMGNGNEHVKSIADHVTASLYEDGLYKACEHFGLI
ncbi:MAG: Cof-type HAD-IIB family hydrolase [Lachnospiraceae bacterium]|nr:Cof-type HAD-IIB family hydrolase [Lachnospiraceae bacterium]